MQGEVTKYVTRRCKRYSMGLHRLSAIIFANLTYKLRRKSIIAVLTSGARSCWVQ